MPGPIQPVAGWMPGQINLARRIQLPGRAVRTRNDDIRVCLQLWAHGMPQMIEVDANPPLDGRT